MADVAVLGLVDGGRVRLGLQATAAPTGSTRNVLWNSVNSLGANKLQDSPIQRISVTLYHTQPGFLEASRSVDGGTTWRVYSRLAVAAPAANTISGAYHYIVEQFANWQLEWVNGGTAQATWEPELIAYETRMPTEDS